MKLPLFKPGARRPSPWSASDLNRMVAVLNQILSARIVRHNKEDRIAFEPSGMVIYLRQDPAARQEPAATPQRTQRVRIKTCDPETGEVHEFEVDGRQIS